jgi:putative DNA primase/helicase
VKLTDDDAAGAEPGRRSRPEKVRRLRVDEVAALLRQNPEGAARALLGEPNKRLSSKKALRFGSKGSLEVVIAGPKRGLWHDHEEGKGGDMLRLAQREKGKAGGLEWARQQVGDHGAAAAPAVRAAPPVRDTSAEDAAREAEKAEKRTAALGLLEKAQPIEGTRAAAYLAARLPGVDVLSLLRPDVLRFLATHRSCPKPWCSNGVLSSVGCSLRLPWAAS